MSTAVFCCDCDGMFLANKSDPPWRALCAFSKNTGGFGFVTRTTWDNEQPYKLCRFVNHDGKCNKFKPKRQPTTE